MSSPFAGAQGFSVDTFKANFNGAARPYMFYVKVNVPGFDEKKAMYLAQASTLPGRKIDKKPIKWQGYEFPLGGITTHDDWKVTFICDAEAGLYKAMIDWANIVHDPKDNTHGLPKAYMRDQYIQLVDNNGAEGVLDIHLIGCWPTDVGSMEVGMETDGILKFDVTFAYVRHEYEGVDY